MIPMMMSRMMTDYVVERGDSENSSSEDINGQFGDDDDDGDIAVTLESTLIHLLVWEKLIQLEVCMIPHILLPQTIVYMNLLFLVMTQ